MDGVDWFRGALGIDCLWGMVASVLWMCPIKCHHHPFKSLCTCFIGYRGSAIMELNGSEMEMGREEWEVETALYIWPEESRDDWWASRVLIRHAALNVSYTLLIILSLSPSFSSIFGISIWKWNVLLHCLWNFSPKSITLLVCFVLFFAG